jgi:hypothetical protein
MKKILLLLCISVFFDASAQLFPDGTFVRSNKDNQIYKVVGNAIFPVLKNSEIKIENNKVFETDEKEFNKLSRIPKDTTLIREVDTKDVYIILKGKKRLVPTKVIELSYAQPYINVVPENGLENIPAGANIPGIGVLAQSHFDTLQKVIAYRLAITYIKLEKNDFKTGDGIYAKKLNDIEIDRLRYVYQTIHEQFGNDKYFGNTVYQPHIDPKNGIYPPDHEPGLDHPKPLPSPPLQAGSCPIPAEV